MRENPPSNSWKEKQVIYDWEQRKQELSSIERRVYTLDKTLSALGLTEPYEILHDLWPTYSDQVEWFLNHPNPFLLYVFLFKGYVTARELFSLDLVTLSNLNHRSAYYAFTELGLKFKEVLELTKWQVRFLSQITIWHFFKKIGAQAFFKLTEETLKEWIANVNSLNVISKFGMPLSEIVLYNQKTTQEESDLLALVGRITTLNCSEEDARKLMKEYLRQMHEIFKPGLLSQSDLQEIEEYTQKLSLEEMRSEIREVLWQAGILWRIGPRRKYSAFNWALEICQSEGWILEELEGLSGIDFLRLTKNPETLKFLKKYRRLIKLIPLNDIFALDLAYLDCLNDTRIYNLIQRKKVAVSFILNLTIGQVKSLLKYKAALDFITLARFFKLEEPYQAFLSDPLIHQLISNEELKREYILEELKAAQKEDKHLIKDVIKCLEEVRSTIAHNGYGFDVSELVNMFCLSYGIVSIDSLNRLHSCLLGILQILLRENRFLYKDHSYSAFKFAITFQRFIPNYPTFIKILVFLGHLTLVDAYLISRYPWSALDNRGFEYALKYMSVSVLLAEEGLNFVNLDSREIQKFINKNPCCQTPFFILKILKTPPEQLNSVFFINVSKLKSKFVPELLGKGWLEPSWTYQLKDISWADLQQMLEKFPPYLHKSMLKQICELPLDTRKNLTRPLLFYLGRGYLTLEVIEKEAFNPVFQSECLQRFVEEGLIEFEVLKNLAPAEVKLLEAQGVEFLLECGWAVESILKEFDRNDVFNKIIDLLAKESYVRKAIREGYISLEEAISWITIGDSERCMEFIKRFADCVSNTVLLPESFPSLSYLLQLNIKLDSSYQSIIQTTNIFSYLLQTGTVSPEEVFEMLPEKISREQELASEVWFILAHYTHLELKNLIGDDVFRLECLMDLSLELEEEEYQRHLEFFSQPRTLQLIHFGLIIPSQALFLLNKIPQETLEELKCNFNWGSRIFDLVQWLEGQTLTEKLGRLKRLIYSDFFYLHHDLRSFISIESKLEGKRTIPPQERVGVQTHMTTESYWNQKLKRNLKKREYWMANYILENSKLRKEIKGSEGNIVDLIIKYWEKELDETVDYRKFCFKNMLTGEEKFIFVPFDPGNPIQFSEVLKQLISEINGGNDNGVAIFALIEGKAQGIGLEEMTYFGIENGLEVEFPARESKFSAWFPLGVIPYVTGLKGPNYLSEETVQRPEWNFQPLSGQLLVSLSISGVVTRRERRNCALDKTPLEILHDMDIAAVSDPEKILCKKVWGSDYVNLNIPLREIYKNEEIYKTDFKQLHQLLFLVSPYTDENRMLKFIGQLKFLVPYVLGQVALGNVVNFNELLNQFFFSQQNSDLEDPSPAFPWLTQKGLTGEEILKLPKEYLIWCADPSMQNFLYKMEKKSIFSLLENERWKKLSLKFIAEATFAGYTTEEIIEFPEEKIPHFLKITSKREKLEKSVNFYLTGNFNQEVFTQFSDKGLKAFISRARKCDSLYRVLFGHGFEYVPVMNSNTGCVTLGPKSFNNVRSFILLILIQLNDSIQPPPEEFQRRPHHPLESPKVTKISFKEEDLNGWFDWSTIIEVKVKVGEDWKELSVIEYLTGERKRFRRSFYFHNSATVELALIFGYGQPSILSALSNENQGAAIAKLLGKEIPTMDIDLEAALALIKEEISKFNDSTRVSFFSKDAYLLKKADFMLKYDINEILYNENMSLEEKINEIRLILALQASPKIPQNEVWNRIREILGSPPVKIIPEIQNAPDEQSIPFFSSGSH